MKVIQYKCPGCGADLEFNAEGQNFTCKYCDSELSEEQLKEIFPDKEINPPNIEEPKKTVEEINEDNYFAEYNALYNCPGCGAAIVTDSTTSATKCFYCHSPVILSGRLSGEYRPSLVIPFKVTEKSAKEALEKHCQKRFFVPKNFKNHSVLSDMMAVYVPYWLAYCNAGGRLSAKCKKIRVWRMGNTEYTETQEYVAVRSGQMLFEGIPADGSSKFDDTLMECIEPFNYRDMKDFKMSFLSGYLAEKYDVEKEKVYPRIKSRACTSATDIMRADITGYNSVNITQNTIDVTKINWKHTLFPVWFLTYKHKEKIYSFAVNGQTGKLSGNIPISWIKLLLTGLLITVLGMIIGGIVGGFL